MAEHQPVFSHAAINRHLMEGDVSPDAVLQSVWHLVRRSGNEHGVVKGIGVVNCVYANLDTGERWVGDCRVYDSDGDGMTMPDPRRDLFDAAI
jgi:hypothetical protein